MKTKKKFELRYRIIMVMSAILAVVVVVNMSLSYLVSTKQRDNVFSLGNVKLILTEDHFPEQEESRVMVPKSIIPKDPKIINTGGSDEYVFIKVVVPLCNVKKVNDNNKIDASAKAYREIFNFISGEALKNTVRSQTFTDNDTGSFEYAQEWILIKTEENQTEHTHSYLFGYSSMLAGGSYQATKTLFDRIQMRNILEGELSVDVAQTILVYAYGIQSEEIMNEVTISDTANVTQAELSLIFALYEKTGGMV